MISESVHKSEESYTYNIMIVFTYSESLLRPQQTVENKFNAYKLKLDF